MQTFIQKISSRKLWAAIVGIMTGLAMIFGLDTNIINTISGAVVAASSVITYILTEGKVDAAAVKAAIEAAQKAKDALTTDTASVSLPSTASPACKGTSPGEALKEIGDAE